MKLTALLATVLFLGSLIFIAVGDADAARLGGGRSFGSKPTMRQSTPAPAQQKAPMAAAAPAQAAAKPGLLGGMGGMLGGILAGTLLGSLLFGGGFSGGGFMDILLIAVLAYIGFKIYARFRANRTATASGPSLSGGSGTLYDTQANPDPMQRQSAGSMWDTLQNKMGGGATHSQEAETSTAPNAAVHVPAGFDTEEFMRGAKLVYTRLQSAWDKRDMDDIAQFATPSVMDELRNQCKEDPTPSTTEILLINAQLMAVTEEAGQHNATVFFDVLLRENAQAGTNQVREVWHFTKPVDDSASWKLDGIQQVE